LLPHNTSIITWTWEDDKRARIIARPLEILRRDERADAETEGIQAPIERKIETRLHWVATPPFASFEFLVSSFGHQQLGFPALQHIIDGRPYDIIKVGQWHRRDNEIERSTLDGFQVEGDILNVRNHNDVYRRWRSCRHENHIFP
jgi:hypothetical protein